MTTDIFGDMSLEEMSARSDAAILGQLKIMQAAITALIAVSPKPDYLRFEIARAFGEMAHERPLVPELAWTTEAIVSGARQPAEAFLRAAESNLNFPKG